VTGQASGRHRGAGAEDDGEINPFEYLGDILARVQDHPTSAIDDLLPGAWAAARDEA
jgi:hypothetical protein